ncbi:MAG: site-specific DNA-methyltransferase [Armatimonadota bacterium]|nr:site-specific DNA-methyltransferase [Armatimonadota bacterium]
MKNTLYYGDNLDIMREHITDESVDLVYLDPPFNSARDYNVLFRQAKKDENQAQIMAFTDTWQWSKQRYEEIFDDPRNTKLFDLMESLYRILGQSEMMAYLVMMAPRLLELYRTLKPTGSLYLHCDPVASHYLKVMLDVIFQPTRFRNEITWKRTSSHNTARRYGNVADILLYYTKSDEWTWNVLHTPYGIKQLSRYKQDEEGRWYRGDDLSADRMNSDSGKFEWRGTMPPPNRGWGYTVEQLEQWWDEGRILLRKDGTPRMDGLKVYLEDSPGQPLQNVWTDIQRIGNTSAERMGYPTQKPLALLERIISASSNPGEIVFDPFCGCGTAVVAAEKLGRQWIGIDVTFIAIDLMIERLNKSFGLKRERDYGIFGIPYDANSAGKLFNQSPKEFEMWAVHKVGGIPQPNKSGDKGVDGKVYFHDLSGKLQWAVCQVKGGHLTPSVIRDFGHVIQRDKAAMGFFICLETPTKGMYSEADELGFFEAPSGRKIPKLQIRTIKELLESKEFDYPKGYSLKSGGKRLTRAQDERELGLE